MKLMDYAKIFLTISVILVVSALIVCGIVWWNDITVKEIWSNYISKPDPWVGIFTSIGAIFTVFVFIVTAYASLKSGESAKIAAKALELSRESSRKDDFIKQFTLLLEQHNEHLTIVKKYLDKKISFVNDIMILKDHYYAFSILNGHSVISPYMRVLYHVLKHIDKDFYLYNKDNDYLIEKKKYSSLVRSLISNDVMKLIAVNSSYIYKNGDYNDYKEYQLLLNKFDFFQHAIFINKSGDKSSHDMLKIQFKNVRDKIFNHYKNIDNNYYSVIKNKSFLYEEDIDIKVMVIISILFKNKLQDFALELFSPKNELIKNGLIKIRDNIIINYSEDSIIKKIIGYREVIIKNKTGLFYTLEDKIKKSSNYRDELKKEIKPLEMGDIKTLVSNYFENQEVCGDIYFKEINEKTYTITKNEMKHQLDSIKRGEEIIESIEGGSYKKYFEDINEQYNKKIKSIFTQSLQLKLYEK